MSEQYMGNPTPESDRFKGLKDVCNKNAVSQIKELQAEVERLKEEDKLRTENFLEIVRQLNESEEKRHMFRWVWCKDEMPERDGFYRVSIGIGTVMELEYIGREWIDIQGIEYYVTQWLKAPEPMGEE